MQRLDTFGFKKSTRRRKSKPSKHLPHVCIVIICNVETGKVIRKTFGSWDLARDYVHNREGSRKYRINIEGV